MDKHNLISELFDLNNSQLKYKYHIKKYSILAIIATLISIYYLIFDHSNNIGFLVILILAMVGLWLKICKLIEKRNADIRRLNLLCIQLYGKSFAQSKLEVHNTINEHIK